MLKSLLLLAVFQSTASTDSIRWEPWNVTVDGRTITGQLGRLRVPADHANRNRGSSIELAFVRLPGTGSASSSPIVYLAGGPGNSGIANVRISSMLTMFDSLRTTGDVILLDQRGTGASRPSLACPAVLPPTTLFRSEQDYRRALVDGMGLCSDSLRARGIDAAHYTTTASAADIDAVRRALGASRIRLFGFSYGTHLAQEVIRRYGKYVDRAMIAGVEGVDDNEKLPLVFDANLHRLAHAVRADSALRRIAPDLLASTDSALARLARSPARVRIPNPLVRGDSVELEIGPFGFQHILARDLGDSNDWPLLPGLIVRSAQGDYGLLSQFARRRWGPLPSLMWAAMDCASGSSVERRAEVQRQASSSQFGAAMNMTNDALCRRIGAVDAGAEFRRPFMSAIPTLFISGSLDNQTPPHQAERVRWGFVNSAHIIVEHAGHESTLDVPAVLAASTRFMRGDEVPSAFVRVPMPIFRGPGR